jgi:hypothetical protein
MSSTTIASAVTNSQGTFYSTMSHAAQLAPDTFLVTFQQRNGRNRRDGKGGTTFMMGALHATVAEGASWLVEPQPGMIQGFGATHHGSCTANYGEASNPQPAAFLVSASATGGAPATGTFVTYENGAIKIGSQVGLQTNIDSGLLSNYYGENPGTQGKNSLYCASLPNPGYGTPGAFRPEVKEFVLVPATSRVPNASGTMAEKLGLDLVLDPEATDAAVSGCGCASNGNELPSLTVLVFGTVLVLFRRRKAVRS